MPPDPPSDDRSRSARPPWPALAAATIVVPTVLAGLTLLWPRPQIEDTLTRGASAALSAAGISGGALHFDGRDATITGSSSDAAGALRTVEGVTGVRTARIGADAGFAALPPGSVPAQAPPSTAAAEPSPTPAPSPSPSVTPPTSAPSAAGTELDAAAKQALQAKLTALLRADPITFGPDSAQLTGRGRRALSAALGVVRTAPAARLELEGFVATGPGNGELTAAQLSDRRAAAVRDAMVAAGVPADHLTGRGRGEDPTARQRAYGRRVDITVV